jgi:hypothetical protein
LSVPAGSEPLESIAIQIPVATAGQQSKQRRALEHLAYPRCGMHDPQHAICGPRQVVDSNQLTHAGRIDRPYPSEIEHNLSLTSTEQIPHVMPESSSDWRPERAVEVEHALHLLARPSARQDGR